ncbi:MAG: FecR domain-containing protein [Pseudomonadota bacterium]
MSSTIASDIVHDAHTWRATMSMPEVSAADWEAFEKWLNADPRHADAYDRAETLFQALGNVDSDALGPDLMRPSRLERRREWVTRVFGLPRPEPRWIGVTASLFVLAMISLVLLLPRFMADPAARAYARSYESGIGELRTVALTDGSSMTLGARSSVSVDFDADFRRVTLLHGVAFFAVASDAQRPFVVNAGSLGAQAVGTSFEVKQSDDFARVAVAEGEVRVTYPQIFFGRPQATRNAVSLTEGEQVAATGAAGLGVPVGIAATSVGAWRTGRLVYKQATLTELVADARRYANFEIVVADSVGDLGNVTVSAFFDAGDVESMLNTLPDIAPVVVVRTPDGGIEVKRTAAE